MSAETKLPFPSPELKQKIKAAAAENRGKNISATDIKLMSNPEAELKIKKINNGGPLFVDITAIKSAVESENGSVDGKAELERLEKLAKKGLIVLVNKEELAEISTNLSKEVFESVGDTGDKIREVLRRAVSFQIRNLADSVVEDYNQFVATKTDVVSPENLPALLDNLGTRNVPELRKAVLDYIDDIIHFNEDEKDGLVRQFALKGDLQSILSDPGLVDHPNENMNEEENKMISIVISAISNALRGLQKEIANPGAGNLSDLRQASVNMFAKEFDIT